MNVIGAGINIYADTGQAENALQRMAQRQTDLLRNSRLFAREFPRNMDTGFTSMNRFRQGIDRTYTSIQQFRYETRRLTNELNSLVMAGVAVSMTGVSFMNFGRTVVGGFTEAVKQATTFEKTMKEIEFLGGLKGQVKEMKEIQNEIMKIGVSLPTTNQKVAEGMVESMRAGFNKNEALKLAPIMSEMAFLSFDKMTEADSLKMMNSWLKTTGKNVDSARGAFDKFGKTADLFTTDLDGINRAFQSTRAAFDTMQLGKQELGEESFLAMIGAMSTQYNARASGMMMNSFSRGLAQAVGSDEGTKRGDLWRSLGIDYEAEDDILSTMDKISKASIKLWGDTKARQEKLIDLFGVEGLPVLQMMEKYEKSGKNIFELRDAIKDSGGYSKEYMDTIMKTSYGTQKILEGTKETLVTLIGLTVLEPVNKILWGLSRALAKITEFVQEHPKVSKFIALMVLSTGVLAMVAGSALLVGGAFMAMYGSVASAIVTLGQLGTTEETLRRGTNSLGLAFRSQIIGPMKTMMFSMARMAVVSGLLYLAWKHDFMGMKTSVTQLFDAFKNGRKLANELFSNNKMTWDQFVEIKKNKDPLTAWFADKYVKAKAFWQLMKGLWGDGVITAEDVGGEAEFNRLSKIWKETGMVEIADTILDWKKNVEVFWKGFLKGGQIAREWILPVFKALGKLLVWIYDKAVWLGEQFGFIKKDATGMAPAFEKMGVVLGTIMGVAGGILMAFRAWRMTLGPIVGILAKIARFSGRGIGGMIQGGRNLRNGRTARRARVRMRNGRRNVADRGRRLFARGLFLDKLFPAIWGADGGVRNPAMDPNMSRAERRRQMGRGHGGRFHQWAWRRTRNRTQPQRYRSLRDLPEYGQSTMNMGSQGGRRVRTLNSRTKWGAFKDILFGRRVDATPNRNGSWGYREINRHGQPVHRNIRRDQLRVNRRGEVRTGRGLFGMPGRMMARGRANRRLMNMINFADAGMDYGSSLGQRGHRRRSVGAAIKGSWNRMRRPGAVAGGNSLANQMRHASPEMRAQAGVGSRAARGKGFGSMFKGMAKAAGKVAPKVGSTLLKGLGKVVTRGIPLLFKGALRLIPFLGWALMAWDIISLIWSNWDFLKNAGSKAWTWIKEKSLAVWEAAKTKGTEIWTAIKNWAGEKWAQIKADGAAKLEEMKSGLSNWWSGLVTDFKTKWAEIKAHAANNPVVQTVKKVVEATPIGNAVSTGLKLWDKLRGHRTGLENVPSEGYPAALHRGEMVLTRREAQVLRAMSGTNSIFDTLMEAKDGFRTGADLGPKTIQARTSSAPAEGGDMSITFAPGSVQITVQSMNSEAEIEKGARKMFEKFKRMVETENMRNYRPARAR